MLILIEVDEQKLTLEEDNMLDKITGLPFIIQADEYTDMADLIHDVGGKTFEELENLTAE